MVWKNLSISTYESLSSVLLVVVSPVLLIYCHGVGVQGLWASCDLYRKSTAYIFKPEGNLFFLFNFPSSWQAVWFLNWKQRCLVLFLQNFQLFLARDKARQMHLIFVPLIKMQKLSCCPGNSRSARWYREVLQLFLQLGMGSGVDQCPDPVTSKSSAC